MKLEGSTPQTRVTAQGLPPLYVYTKLLAYETGTTEDCLRCRYPRIIKRHAALLLFGEPLRPFAIARDYRRGKQYLHVSATRVVPTGPPAR